MNSFFFVTLKIVLLRVGLLVSEPEQFTTPEKFVYLWLHESERVYGDRLVSYEDLNKYNSLVQAQHKKVFASVNITRFFSGETADPLIFCHFADNIQDKVYDMVSSVPRLSIVLEGALLEYNETNATMDLGNTSCLFCSSLCSCFCVFLNFFFTATSFLFSILLYTLFSTYFSFSFHYKLHFHLLNAHFSAV